MQGLKEVHDARSGPHARPAHNFKASGFYSLEDLNDPSKTAETRHRHEVMDYNPVNIMPEGDEAGRLFLDDDRPLRHVGDRIRLQAAQGRLAGRRSCRS